MGVTTLIYAGKGFRLPQDKDLAMGSKHKFKIFENTDGDGVIKHAGDAGNLEITVKNGNAIKFGSNDTSNCAKFMEADRDVNLSLMVIQNLKL